MVIGIIGCSCTISLSVIYHVFRDHGDRAFTILLKLDLSGIVVMLFALTISGLWLGMKAWPDERISMLILISIIYCANLMISFVDCCPCCPGTHH